MKFSENETEFLLNKVWLLGGPDFCCVAQHVPQMFATIQPKFAIWPKDQEAEVCSISAHLLQSPHERN